MRPALSPRLIELRFSWTPLSSRWSPASDASARMASILFRFRLNLQGILLPCTMAIVITRSSAKECRILRTIFSCD